MTSRDGWITFIVAVGAGVVVWFADNFLSSRTAKGINQNTVIPQMGNGPIPQPQPTGSPVQSLPLSDQADVDTGTAPTPQVQTEAAYNANGTSGMGDDITYGETAANDDYGSYDEPSEAYL